MPRQYAQVHLNWWADDEWRSLRPRSQHLYMVLISQPKMGYAGVTDWRPKRLAQLSHGWHEADIYEAAMDLSEARLVVVDQEAEEILVRHFVANQGLLRQPKLAISMLKAIGEVLSSTIRGVIVDDLKDLMRDEPDLPCWQDERLIDLLEQRSIRADELNPDFGIPQGVIQGDSQGAAQGAEHPEDSPALLGASHNK